MRLQSQKVTLRRGQCADEELPRETRGGQTDKQACRHAEVTCLEVTCLEVTCLRSYQSAVAVASVLARADSMLQDAFRLSMIHRCCRTLGRAVSIARVDGATARAKLDQKSLRQGDDAGLGTGVLAGSWPAWSPYHST